MKNICALLFFLILTIIATHPLPQHIAASLVEPGDSLLNTWVISWDIKKILTDPVNLFHANIFYPYKYTLAYTEHMLGNALLGMPVYLATKNPILVYNLVLLATFIIGGWGMFLLVRHLTKSPLAGIIAGVIFVFNPYRFYALAHLHVLSIQWLPFTLLYLHRYFHPAPAGRGGIQNHRNKDLLGFFIFFLLQSTASGHIGLYQGFIVGLFLFFIVVSRENTRGRHWLKFALALGLAGFVLLPLYLPYMHLAEELKFVRAEQELKLFSATFEDFRGVIFPGALAIILAVLGVFHPRSKTDKRRRIIVLVNICILMVTAIIIYVIAFGEIDLGYSIFNTDIRVKDLENPFIILLVLLIARLFLQRKEYYPARFYLVLAVAGFLFCLGPEIELKETYTGPYMLLYNYFPGFKGLRVPSRWAVVFMFAVAVLAGLGWKKLERRNWVKWTAFPVVLLFLLHGYRPAPLILRFNIGERPPVYQWLASQPDEDVIIELPMPDWYHNFYHEAIYMYWSLYHNKRMVNGYSGYSPPPYWHIVELMHTFPSEDSIRILQYLGVKYIVMHNGIEEPGIFSKDLALRYEDGRDRVYELISKFQPEEKEAVSNISRENWLATASHNSFMAKNACDNDLNTRWDTGNKQASGMWFQLDLGEVSRISRISLYMMGSSRNDYPRGVGLSVSEDGHYWKEIDLRFSYSEFAIGLIEDPSRAKMDLDFSITTARYIKLTIAREHCMFYWSIHEIDVGGV